MLSRLPGEVRSVARDSDRVLVKNVDSGWSKTSSDSSGRKHPEPIEHKEPHKSRHPVECPDSDAGLRAELRRGKQTGKSSRLTMIHFFSLRAVCNRELMLLRATKGDSLIPVEPAPSKIQGSHDDVTVVEHLVEKVSNRSDGMQGKNGQSSDSDPTLSFLQSVRAE